MLGASAGSDLASTGQPVTIESAVSLCGGDPASTGARDRGMHAELSHPLVKPAGKQRNCEHAACARGLTKYATFIPSSLRGGNERHSAGWFCRASGAGERDFSGLAAGAFAVLCCRSRTFKDGYACRVLRRQAFRTRVRLPPPPPLLKS